MKGNSSNFVDVIIDHNLTVIESAPSFYKFFNKRKNWNPTQIKITQLIEFEDLSNFKKIFFRTNFEIEKNKTFRGKIKNKKSDQPILIKVTQLKNKSEKWNNQMVNLSFEVLPIITNPGVSTFNINSFASQPFEIFTVGPSLKLIYFNLKARKNYNKLFNNRPQIGDEFVFEKLNDTFWRKKIRSIFSSEILFFEKMENLNGELHLIVLSQLYNSTGEIVACNFSLKNIENIKKVSSSIKNDKQYQYLFDNNILGIGLLNEKLELLTVNDTICRLTETPKEKMNLDVLTSFMDSDTCNLVSNKIKQIINQEIIDYTMEVKILYQNISMKYAQIGLKGLYKKGQFEGCVFNVLDITKQKHADIQEEEIKVLKNQERLNKEHQQILQEELDSKLRELHSNLILISKKNQLLKSIENRINKVIAKNKKDDANDLKEIIKSITSQINFDNSWERFKIHFVKMNPDFFRNLKICSRELSENELRHCAYIRIGLSVKETSQLLSVLPSSIEMARYRIKKKLKLDKDQKLSNFIRRF